MTLSDLSILVEKICYLFWGGGVETVKLTIQMIPREINPSSVSAYEVLLKIAHSGSLQRFLN